MLLNQLDSADADVTATTKGEKRWRRLCCAGIKNQTSAKNTLAAELRNNYVTETII